MTERTPVDGPYRIAIDTIPTGITLDISHYLTAVLLNIASAADDDTQGLLDDLTNIAELARSAATQGPDSHAAHERDERVADLLAEVADDGQLPVYGGQCLALADRIRRLAEPRVLPARTGRGAAA